MNTIKNQASPNQIMLDGSTQQQQAEDRAIESVRFWHEMAKGEPIYVAFSGGKDSGVTRDIVRRSAELDGVPLAQYADFHYNITGVDPPELIYFMRRTYADLQWHMYEQSMWRLIEERGPITRLRRFCCENLKERGGQYRYCCTGVRWAESVRRANQRTFFEAQGSKKPLFLFNDVDEAREKFEFCGVKRKNVCNPIIHFTDANVWEYIGDRKLPYCSLYDEGWKRLGCIGCPMAGDKRWAEFERWPKYKDMYIRAFDRMLLRYRERGKSYKLVWNTAQDVFDWWMQDRNMDKQMPDQMAWDDYFWME